MEVNKRENNYGKIYTIVIFVVGAIKLHYLFNTYIFFIFF